MLMDTVHPWMWTDVLQGEREDGGAEQRVYVLRAEGRLTRADIPTLKGPRLRMIYCSRVSMLVSRHVHWS